MELFYLTNAFSFFVGYAWVSFLRDLQTLVARIASSSDLLSMGAAWSYLSEALCAIAFGPGLTWLLVRTRQRWGGASVTLKILPALLCVSADYAGLAAITPILPFHLRDRCGVEDGDATAIWTGIISSSQFAAVMLACLVWGGVADRIGAKRTVQITMLGDLVTFTASAFVTSPVAMLIARFCAGSSASGSASGSRLTLAWALCGAL